MGKAKREYMRSLLALLCERYGVEETRRLARKHNKVLPSIRTTLDQRNFFYYRVALMISCCDSPDVDCLLRENSDRCGITISAVRVRRYYDAISQ